MVKFSDIIREHSKRHGKSETVNLAIRLVGGDSDIEQAEDGGPGSGNWGHKGRPGKVGGSSSEGGTSSSSGRDPYEEEVEVSAGLEEEYRNHQKERKKKINKEFEKKQQECS